MLQNLFKYKFKIVLLVILIGFLLLIRNFETQLFYDPFIIYFKDEFVGKPYPEYDFIKLFGFLKLRYFLNSLISLVILYVIFEDKSIVKFAAFLYFVFLVLLLLSIFFLLQFFDENHAMTFFYLRRFVIQPISLILFIPAFYYQKKNS